MVGGCGDREQRGQCGRKRSRETRAYARNQLSLRDIMASFRVRWFFGARFGAGGYLPVRRTSTHFVTEGHRNPLTAALGRRTVHDKSF
jgi:hypothetical protein